MEDLLFYIMIPIYKTENTISKCIESVLEQEYQNFKVVLVDDGTPDRAGEIADDYAKRDVRIKVLHKKNQGLMSARRVAIDYVKEQSDSENAYFMFLDSDDYLERSALSVVRETVLREKCDVVVFCMQRVAEGEFLGFVETNPFVGVVTDKRELYKRVFFDSVYNPLCRKAIKGSLMQSVDYSPYYHISFGEDLIQSIPIYGACEKVAFISDVLYNYTLNPNSITQKIDPDKYAVDSTVRSLVLEFIQNEKRFTSEDVEEYLHFCRRLMRSEVVDIALFEIPYRNVKKILNRMRADTYYAHLLKGADEYVLFCLGRGLFFPFVIPLRFRKWFKTLCKQIGLWRKYEG